MVGRPMRKVFCQGFTRAGRREGKLIPCRMKGHELANGTYYCKYHGFQNKLGFNKKNYTDETRIKQLSKLLDDWWLWNGQYFEAQQFFLFLGEKQLMIFVLFQLVQLDQLV